MVSNLQHYPTLSTLIKIIEQRPSMSGAFYLVEKKATKSELNFLEYFYPPYIGINVPCIWVDTINEVPRIGTYDPNDIQELMYFSLNGEIRSHFHKPAGDIT